MNDIVTLVNARATLPCLAAGLVALALSAAACRADPSDATAPARVARPSLLLVTMDTTRADAMGPDAAGVATPAFNALAASGRRFRQAYAAVPETLPSHAAILSGLYPAGHGLHENARYLPAATPLVAEILQRAGYRTTAVVSSFVLARRFGLARGFDVYDDQWPGGAAERDARATTDVAVADLATPSPGPRFLWVHYNDPHAPYAPTEPFRSRYPKAPYLGEIAAMDAQLGRLIEAFRAVTGDRAGIIVVADHGEGLGEHGEAQHGHLLYQSTMHVPLVVTGPGVAAGVDDTPVSTRRVHHTLLDWAELGTAHSLRAGAGEPEVVLGEAMKPFLEYGWQPQVMAVDARDGLRKAILSGRVEGYDLAADAAERTDLAAGPALPNRLRNALFDYPVPVPGQNPEPSSLGAEDRQKLASLGYVSGGATPVVRKDAPRAADMVGLLPTIEQISSLFVAGRYAQAVPLLQRVRGADRFNLDATLRLATAYSAMGRAAEADRLFAEAAALAPSSDDVTIYRALHQAKGVDWPAALPVLERAAREQPGRQPVIDALAAVRERQGQGAMARGDTPAALAAFEAARALRGAAFRYQLELGVLYLAARRLPEARTALDAVALASPGYPMALFKRAQVAVLLGESDAAQRIAAARAHADATTRRLIQSERLFQGK